MEPDKEGERAMENSTRGTSRTEEEEIAGATGDEDDSELEEVEMGNGYEKVWLVDCACASCLVTPNTQPLPVLRHRLSSS